MSSKRFSRKTIKKKNRMITAVSALLMLIAAAVIVLQYNGANEKGGRAEKNIQPNAQLVPVDGEAMVTFIDVGQGDSTLVQSAGHVMLIDTGDRDDKDVLKKYLRSCSIEKIDYLVLTHPHADHIGEAAEIIREFDVEKVIAPDIPENLIPTTAVFEDLLDAMDEKGMKFTRAENDSFELGEMQVEEFVPIGNYSDLNDHSVVLRLKYGKNSFLVTGDCSEDEEYELLDRGGSVSADVLKVGHHGSKTSTTQAWLESVDPEYAVISCGANNRYGHPADETVERIEDFGAKLYITAEDGSVTFISDGKKLTASCTK